ncbi:MAG: XdhC family protein [Thermoanaerobaculales bacterium]
MQVLRRLLEIVDGGDIAVLATVVAVTGSAPRRPGARMLLSSGGAREGTVGGGEVEAAALAAAEEMLAGGKPGRVFELPIHCGGKVTLMLEKFAPPQRVLVVGAGHVGAAVAAVAAQAGYLVTVASPSGGEELRGIPGIEPARASGPEFLAQCEHPNVTHVIVATGNGDVDGAWAVAALLSSFATVGVIGSRTKAAAIRQAASSAGVPEARMRVFRCPVGLDLGAVTPEEIAVSIVAELVKLDRTGEVPEGWRRTSQA